MGLSIERWELRAEEQNISKTQQGPSLLRWEAVFYLVAGLHFTVKAEPEWQDGMGPVSLRDKVNISQISCFLVV